MMCVKEATRLVVADDHSLIRKGLESILSIEEDFHLLSSVSNGEELVAAVKQHKPHVVITDLNMPFLDGPGACKQIQTISPETSVIVYSMYDSKDIVRQMRALGVSGYLLKSGDSVELARAIRVVRNGGDYYAQSIRDRTAHFFLDGSLGRGNGEKKGEFTEKELQIIDLICQEQPTKVIADKLKLKERTVQTHKESIEEKMGVCGVVGIAVYAMRNWLLY